MASQAQGIFRARRNNSDMKERGDCIEPVCKRENGPHGCLGQPPIHRSGEIMLRNGGTDLGIFLVVFGVLATHDTLKCGKFADDSSQQIGLTQLSRSLTALAMTESISQCVH